MPVVEVRNLEGMWILFAPLGGYVSKLGASAPTRLGLFFFALDVYMTRRTKRGGGRWKSLTNTSTAMLILPFCVGR